MMNRHKLFGAIGAVIKVYVRFAIERNLKF
jgi:hypothetical protein